MTLPNQQTIDAILAAAYELNNDPMRRLLTNDHEYNIVSQAAEQLRALLSQVDELKQEVALQCEINEAGGAREIELRRQVEEMRGVIGKVSESLQTIGKTHEGLVCDLAVFTMTLAAEALSLCAPYLEKEKP